MTEVGAADLSRLLHSKRNEYDAIVTSRKRKLRELFAVATHAESLPRDGFTNPDATEPTPSESQFLQANDILQDKLFDDATLPKRSEPNVGFFVQSLHNLLFPPADPHPAPTAVATKIDIPTPSQPIKQPQPIIPNARQVQPALAGRLTPASSVSSPLSAPVDSKSSSVSPVNGGPHVSAAPKAPNREVRPSPPSLAPVAKAADTRTKQPPQVSFPPGTKGPSSTAPNPKAPVLVNGGRNGGPSSGPNGSPAPAGGAAEQVKTSDAVSSPGSTAASAATPHVRTASTETSPDKDVPPKIEPVQEKSTPAPPGTAVPSTTQDREESQDASSMVVDSAEQQLLQESRLSAQAATPRAPSGEPTKSPVAAHPTTTTPAPAPAASSISTTKVSEIPDSQEELPDKMEIDNAPSVKETPASAQPPQDSKPSAQATPAASQLPQSPPKENAQVTERAVTRVSSGAMRLKSVNEIVGAASKPTTPAERPTTAEPENQLTPLTSTSHSPSIKFRHGRPQSRGQVSAVLFGKQPKRSEEKTLAPDDKEIIKPEDDYFTPLFVQGFTNSSSWMQPIEKLLYQANKTIATPDALLALQDHQACKVLRRVYHLQQNDKWSLRQPKRCPEPTRQATHWDVLLKEVKWMRTDFREERKWKMALARNLAYACAEWHAAPAEVRKEMQVPAHIPPRAEAATDVSMIDADEDADEDAPENQPTPDLISSADSPQNIEELSDDFAETVAPSAIFALQEDDLVFGLRRSPTADRLLDELPIFSSPLQVPKVDPLNPDFDPDALWRRPALPLSKYVEGQMKVVAPVPPRKRSRYDYEDESSDDETEMVFGSDDRAHHVRVPPASDAVALFKPEMKHTRDRLHAGHQFRPPSEHPMPVQSFYECRSPSQWTQSEDDELRSLVREYTYNWPLISGMLSSRSQFTSGAERRTPWECFERWINLEGLPADMSKTQYFKAYNSRIEAAQRVIMQQNQLAAQQASASGNNSTPLRRRPSTPLRVERRRNQKHLTLIDAMRKLAKKRETQQQKQQQTAAQSAANKKPIDTSNQRLPTKTPRDYSLLRWERDQALAERMAQYAAKQDAQRRAALQAARGQGQAVQAAAGQAQAAQGGVPAAQQINHAGAVNVVNGVPRSNITSHVAAAAVAAAAAQQGRPRLPLQAPVNGMANNGGVQAHMNSGLAAPAAHMNGQPQMQAALQAQQQQLSQQQQQRVQMPASQAELMLRAQRMAEQQRNAIQMQQQHAQQLPQHQQHMQQQQQQQAQAQQNNAGTPGSQGTQGSPPIRNGVANINQQSFMNNAQNILAQYGANGGHGTPKAGLHMPSVAAGSPGQAQVRPQPQFPNNISAQLAQLEANFLAKNPSLTPEQTRQLATEHLTRAMMQQRQSAMNAAAGGAAAAAALANAQPGIANGMTATTSPHQYAALLRQQQQQQANQAAQSASPVPQAQQIAHQRQSSEGSTPSVPK